MTVRAVKRGTVRARQLRRDQTPEERVVWRELRAGQLGLKFRRQWPVGGYVVDFVCFEARLIVELDGGQHAEESARAYDAARTAVLEAGGFTVLRFWNNEVRQNLPGVLDSIDRHCRQQDVLPSPGGRGVGGEGASRLTFPSTARRGSSQDLREGGRKGVGEGA
ncbi:endonuclease domain-containing protein [Deinococcus caeni]|uniref:endonuclease domain-containing protein n=1 Tax=Deinococcus caeni TaxID=569127 RepID=UPI00360EB6B3